MKTGRHNKPKPLTIYGQGFTLSELLISLALLGVIATFTIPKVLVAQQNASYKAKAKEAAATITAAYDAYRLNNGPVGAGVGIQDLTPYMNFLQVDTSSNVDDIFGFGSWSCGPTAPCLKFHNGGILRYDTASFGGQTTLNAVYVHFDPDGVYGGTTNGPGKSVSFFLYYDGRITDEGNLRPGTTNSVGGFSANPSLVPPWFSWN